MIIVYWIWEVKRKRHDDCGRNAWGRLILLLIPLLREGGFPELLYEGIKQKG